MSHKEEIEWFTPEERMPEPEKQDQCSMSYVKVLLHLRHAVLMAYFFEETLHNEIVRSFKVDFFRGNIKTENVIAWAYAPKGIKQ